MGMVTEQKLVDPVVQGGAQIQTHPLELSNYNLLLPLQAACDLIKGVLECDSANSRAQFSPDDALMVLAGWNLVKTEMTLGHEFSNMAKGKHERSHYLTVPIDNEVATCSNIQARRLAQALLNFVYVGLGDDSSTMQFHLGPKGRRDLDRAAQQVEKVIELYIGDGQKLGMEAPVYPTGTLQPFSNLGSVNLREPSTAVPASGIADVADEASSAPAPGARQPSR